MPSRHPLQEIKSFPSLVKYLRDELEWPISSESFDDLTFEFAPEELGLDAKAAAKVREIKQLRPLVTNQPWGIFFVNFERKRLPIVALRKILGNLAIKKRASANPADRAAWQLHDLLFISSFGEEDDRQITLAHFSEAPNGHDIPTLKVLGWDELDTQLNLREVDRQLHERLRWPNQPRDIATWRNQWSAAFTLRPRHVISTAQELAERLADLARSIRQKVAQVLDIETERGALKKLFAAFREALIHDLEEDDFADMYAQTITYGLFSAAVSRTTPDMGTKVLADNLADMVPITNPFLKEMLSTFLTVGGRRGKLDFDELGIQEVVEVLNSSDTNLNSVVLNFGDRRQGEDPVIHFYEDFLKQYDKQRKVERGVFYTPQPVVSYIVRSVHEILRTEFGLEDGLASTATWAEMQARFPDLKLPTISELADDGMSNVELPIDPQTPFVQILDPATGTATFLVAVIDVIHSTLTERWTRQGLNREQQHAAWNDYVPKHLLPRLYGYELMMAPYAIAHMKVGLKLGETGYTFGSRERVRVYLTNALEPASPEKQQKRIAELSIALAHEAQAVNDVKRHRRFTVVIGNPPYSIQSQNLTTSSRAWADPYRYADGQLIREKGALQFEKSLQDDCVKFASFSQRQIIEAGTGVLGLIMSHSFVDNPTLRGMRQSICQSFGSLHIVDLHGNSTKKERCPDGCEDKNVFDIKQGVAILVGCRGIRLLESSTTWYAELWGGREAKYSRLGNSSVGSTGFQLTSPSAPFYLFKPQNTELRAELEDAFKVTDIFIKGNVGIITARDNMVIDFDAQPLIERATRFRDSKQSDEALCATLDISLKKGWDIIRARQQIKGDKNLERFIKPLCYRPFDSRLIFYHPSLVWGMSFPTMKHMLDGRNLAMMIGRAGQVIGQGDWDILFCTRGLTEFNLYRRGGHNLFPLYLLPEVGDSQTNLAGHEHSRPNLAPRFLRVLCASLGIPQDGSQALPPELTPEDIFHYIYAVLHSPGYRKRYAEFLRIDFPRIPLPGSLELFRELAQLGGELVSLHLLESPRVEKFRTKFFGDANAEIDRVGWSNDTVWIDAPARKRDSPQQPGSVGFQGVLEEVWNFHIGGYQVCEKWLKDRKGRRLSADDIAHYQKIVGALGETIRIMTEIDEVIDRHGGWPGAFAVGAPPDDGQSQTDEPEQATLPFV